VIRCDVCYPEPFAGLTRSASVQMRRQGAV